MAGSALFNAFSWAPTAQADTPEDRRNRMVDALMQQAGDTSPISSAWQGVNRIAAGVGAGLFSDPNWKLSSIFGEPKKLGAVTPGTGDLY